MPRAGQLSGGVGGSPACHLPPDLSPASAVPFSWSPMFPDALILGEGQSVSAVLSRHLRPPAALKAALDVAVRSPDPLTPTGRNALACWRVRDSLAGDLESSRDTDGRESWEGRSPTLLSVQSEDSGLSRSCSRRFLLRLRVLLARTLAGPGEPVNAEQEPATVTPTP